MFGVEETSNLYFATQAKSVSEGLDQQLEGFIREHPDVRLIIIDTLQKVREIGGDRYSYASDYEIVTRLKTSVTSMASACWWFITPGRWKPRIASI